MTGNRHGAGDSPDRSVRVAVFGTSLLALTGFLLILYMTTWGIGATPDSVSYVRTAREIAGQATDEHTSAAQHAPFYPLLLAATSSLGLDPVDGARWLGAILFASNIVLTGSLLRTQIPGAHWPWIAGSVLMLVSVPSLQVHAMALSEPVFVLAGFGGMLFLGVFLKTSVTSALLAAAFGFAIAFLTRYAGAAFIGTGALAILLFGPQSFRFRFRAATALSVISALPMTVWVLRSAAAGGTGMGREILFHPISRSDLWQALYTASAWLLIPVTAPDVLRFTAFGAIALGVTYAVVERRRRSSEDSASEALHPVGRVLALFVPVYGLFLVVSISFFDANITLGDRILFPAHVALIVLAVKFLHDLADRPRIARVGLLALTLLAGGHLIKSVEVAAAANRSGLGLNSRMWHESDFLSHLESLPPDTPIYSNAPDAVYLHAERAALSLPRSRFLMSDRPNAQFASEMEQLRDNLRDRCGIVAYFRQIGLSDVVPDEHSLRYELDLSVRRDDEQGVLLAPIECPPDLGHPADDTP